MKFREDRPFAGDDAAVKELLEIANGLEPDHAGRINVGAINAQFMSADGERSREGVLRAEFPRSRLAKVLNRVMTEKFAPPSVTIRRYRASPICDVVVVFRDQEMVIRCPSYSQATKWARLECKSYKIPEFDIDFPDDNQETDDLPLFLRSDKN